MKEFPDPLYLLLETLKTRREEKGISGERNNGSSFQGDIAARLLHKTG